MVELSGRDSFSPSPVHLGGKDVRLGEQGWKERYYRVKFDVKDMRGNKKFFQRWDTLVICFSLLQNIKSIYRRIIMGYAILLPRMLFVELVLSVSLCSLL